MLLIIYKSRKTDSLIGASPSGKAPGFGPGISEVRILPPQSNKMRVERLSFFMRKERTINRQLNLKCPTVSFENILIS